MSVLNVNISHALCAFLLYTRFGLEIQINSIQFVTLLWVEAQLYLPEVFKENKRKETLR